MASEAGQAGPRPSFRAGGHERAQDDLRGGAARGAGAAPRRPRPQGGHMHTTYKAEVKAIAAAPADGATAPSRRRDPRAGEARRRHAPRQGAAARQGPRGGRERTRWSRPLRRPADERRLHRRDGRRLLATSRWPRRRTATPTARSRSIELHRRGRRHATRVVVDERRRHGRRVRRAPDARRERRAAKRRAPGRAPRGRPARQHGGRRRSRATTTSRATTRRPVGRRRGRRTARIRASDAADGRLAPRGAAASARRPGGRPATNWAAMLTRCSPSCRSSSRSS